MFWFTLIRKLISIYNFSERKMPKTNTDCDVWVRCYRYTWNSFDVSMTCAAKHSRLTLWPAAQIGHEEIIIMWIIVFNKLQLHHITSTSFETKTHSYKQQWHKYMSTGSIILHSFGTSNSLSQVHWAMGKETQDTWLVIYVEYRGHGKIALDN